MCDRRTELSILDSGREPIPCILSYGGGVNSTALAVLVCEGKLPEYDVRAIVFADTLTERDETYSYIEAQMKPYLHKHSRELIVVRPKEGVLERWERLGRCPNRMTRACTDHAKIQPIRRWRELAGIKHDLVAFAAEESHRAEKKYKRSRAGNVESHYPLIDMDIDRDDCKEIIKAAGLCVPIKSGCWCCPFMRVSEILDLCRTYPSRAKRIERLERIASAKTGGQRTSFGHKPMSYWIERASAEAAQGQLFPDDEFDDAMPCRCWAD